MDTEPRYNVYIIHNSGHAEGLIGENLREERAELRVMTGLSRIDRKNFFVAEFEVGSEEDLKAKADINNH